MNPEDEAILRQGQVESELGWVIHHARQAELKQGQAPTSLRWHTREDLRLAIGRLQALLNDAEENYRAMQENAA